MSVDALLAPQTDDTAWWRAAVELYRTEAEHSVNDAEAMEHLLEAGRILAEQLDAPFEAYAAFDAASARAPRSPAPLMARADLAESEADWREATECLRAALSRTSDGARVPVLARLATLAERRLNRPEEAYELLREAARLAPADRDLLARLEVARPLADTAGRAEVLERRLTGTMSLPERAELLAELGALLEDGDPGRASRMYADAFAADPNVEDAVRGLIRSQLGRHRARGLIRTLETHVGRIRDPAWRRRVQVICGLVRDAGLDAPAEALAVLDTAAEGAVEIDADAALVAERAGDSAAAARWLDRHPPAPEELALHAWRRAAAARAEGEGPAEIAERLRAGMGGEDDLLLVLAARRLWWSEHEAQPYLEATEQVLAAARTAAGREALQLHLADAAWWWFGDEGQALEHAQSALRAWHNTATPGGGMPEALAVRRPLLQATGGLDALRADLRDALPRVTDPAGRGQINEWLAELQTAEDGGIEATQLALADPSNLAAVERARGECADLDALRRIIEASTGATGISVTRQVALWNDLAEAEWRAGEADAAQTHWQLALNLDPLSAEARSGLGQAWHRAQDWPALAALSDRELAAMGPGDPRRLDAALRLARLKVEHLGDPAGAVATLAPIDGDAARAELLKIADRLGDPEVLRAALLARTQAGHATAIELLELSGLESDAGLSTARARAEAALALTPEDPLALWVVEAYALAVGDYDRTLALYREQLEVDGPRGERRVIRHKLAGMTPADQAREQMLAMVAEDADAAWYMILDAAARGDGEVLVARLMQLSHLLGDDAAAAACLREAAARAELLGMPEEDRLAVWERLGRRAVRAGDARVALLARARQKGDHDAQAALLTEVARGLEDPDHQGIALWIAGLALEKTAPTEAGRLYQRAADLATADPVPRLLGLRVGPEGGPLAGADRAARLEEVASLLVSDGRAARLLATAARLREAEGDASAAERNILHAAFRYPARGSLVEKAETILDAHGEVDALVALLEARQRIVADPDARMRTLRRLAHVHIELRNDRPAAVAAWEAVVAACPDDLGARVELASLLVGLERYDHAAGHFRVAARLATEREDRIEYHTRVGELLARHLHRPKEAIEALRTAVGLFEPTGRALEVLAEVYLHAGELDLALLAYQRLERMNPGINRLSIARAGQVHALRAADREDEGRERLSGFLAQDPLDPLLTALARELNVEVPALDAAVASANEAHQAAAMDAQAFDALESALGRVDEASKSEPLDQRSQPAPKDPEAGRALDEDALRTLRAALAGLTTGADGAAVAADPEVDGASQVNGVVADAEMVDAPALTSDMVVDAEVVDAPAATVDVVADAEVADGPSPAADVVVDVEPVDAPTPTADVVVEPMDAAAPTVDVVADPEVVDAPAPAADVVVDAEVADAPAPAADVVAEPMDAPAPMADVVAERVDARAQAADVVAEPTAAEPTVEPIAEPELLAEPAVEAEALEPVADPPAAEAPSTPSEVPDLTSAEVEGMLEAAFEPAPTEPPSPPPSTEPEQPDAPLLEGSPEEAPRGAPYDAPIDIDAMLDAAPEDDDPDVDAFEEVEAEAAREDRPSPTLDLDARLDAAPEEPADEVEDDPGARFGLDPSPADGTVDLAGALELEVEAAVAAMAPAPPEGPALAPPDPAEEISAVDPMLTDDEFSELDIDGSEASFIDEAPVDDPALFEPEAHPSAVPPSPTPLEALPAGDEMDDLLEEISVLELDADVDLIFEDEEDEGPAYVAAPPPIPDAALSVPSLASGEDELPFAAPDGRPDGLREALELAEGSAGESTGPGGSLSILQRMEPMAESQPPEHTSALVEAEAEALYAAHRSSEDLLEKLPISAPPLDLHDLEMNWDDELEEHGEDVLEPAARGASDGWHDLPEEQGDALAGAASSEAPEADPFAYEAPEPAPEEDGAIFDFEDFPGLDAEPLEADKAAEPPPDPLEMVVDDDDDGFDFESVLEPASMPPEPVAPPVEAVEASDPPETVAVEASDPPETVAVEASDPPETVAAVEADAEPEADGRAGALLSPPSAPSVRPEAEPAEPEAPEQDDEQEDEQLLDLADLGSLDGLFDDSMPPLALEPEEPEPEPAPEPPEAGSGVRAEHPEWDEALPAWGEGAEPEVGDAEDVVDLSELDLGAESPELGSGLRQSAIEEVSATPAALAEAPLLDAPLESVEVELPSPLAAAVLTDPLIDEPVSPDVEAMVSAAFDFDESDLEDPLALGFGDLGEAAAMPHVVTGEGTPRRPVVSSPAVPALRSLSETPVVTPAPAPVEGEVDLGSGPDWDFTDRFAEPTTRPGALEPDAPEATGPAPADAVLDQALAAALEAVSELEAAPPEGDGDDELELAGAPSADPGEPTARPAPGRVEADDTERPGAIGPDAHAGLAEPAPEVVAQPIEFAALTQLEALYDGSAEPTRFEPDDIDQAWEAEQADGRTAFEPEAPAEARTIFEPEGPELTEGPAPRSPPDRPSRPLAALSLLRTTTGGVRIDADSARTRIREAPVDLSAWRVLRKAVAGEPAHSRWLADVCAWLDGRVHRGQSIRPSLTAPDGLRQQLLPETVPAPVLQLLRRVALPTRLALERAVPTPTSGLATVAADSVLHEVAERVATALGAASFRVVYDDARPFTSRIAAGSTPSVILGRELVAAVQTAGLSFLLSRSLVPIVEGTLAARVLSERDFSAFFSALLLVLGGAPSEDDFSGALERMRGALEPLIDDRSDELRALAASAAEALAGRPLTPLRRGLDLYNDRLALAVSDGFGGAIEMLRLLAFDERPRSALGAEELREFVRETPVAHDLLVFAGSAECLAMRYWLVEESS